MSDKSILFAFLGAVLGLLVSRDSAVIGFVFGALSGFLLAAVHSLKGELAQLRQQLQEPGSQAEVKVTKAREEAPAIEPKPAEAAPPQEAVTEEPAAKAQYAARGVESGEGKQFSLQATQKSAEATVTPPRSAPLSNRVSDYIRRFFTDGNTVVRVGLLILFVGLGFLLKYAAENSLFPIELRLAGVFLLGVALLIIGWRLRLRRSTFALLLQGGAVGIMYLTIFAAAKLYTLFPLPLALAVMVALVVASSLLAILQDSRALAMFAAAGGFLAPVLTSTGSGNHVMLFSYYVLLNAGILFIAWHKTWRELNLEGYLFTFIIGSLWAASSYTPAHFNSTEPFLLIFFLMFVAISVLFAQRRAPSLKDYVDATLVFGVPISAFALQGLMLHDSEYGLAFTALGFGAFYVLLATLLWRLHRENLRLLTESFIALGTGFLTLAIPFAVDGQVTAAAWALEGAGLLWVGVRQGRRLPLASGVVLQFMAGLFFFQESIEIAQQALPFLHAVYLSGLLIALAGLFCAWYMERHAEQKSFGDVRLDIVLFIWGGLWWYGSALHEIFHHHGLWGMNEVMAMILLLSLSGVILHIIDRRYTWPNAAATLGYHIPALTVLSLFVPLAQGGNVLDQQGYVVLPLAAVVHYYLLKQREQGTGSTLLAVQHMLITWWLIYMACWEVYWLLTTKGSLNDTWGYLAWGLIPALFALGLLQLVKRGPWPFRSHAGLYASKVVSPLFLFTWLWVIFATNEVGDPSPLPYISVLNPLELSSLLLLLLGTGWILGLRRQGTERLILLTPYQLAIALGITGFIWLNGVLARSVHYYAGVAYEFDPMFHSTALQMAIAIAWTLLALSMTYLAHRLARRSLWIVGVALLAVVVVKLIFIDLANSGTIERIVSFISVGLLMLVIGYVSPLPPQKKGEGQA